MEIPGIYDTHLTPTYKVSYQSCTTMTDWYQNVTREQILVKYLSSWIYYVILTAPLLQKVNSVPWLGLEGRYWAKAWAS